METPRTLPRTVRSKAGATPPSRSRWAAIGAAIAVTLGGAGIGGYSAVRAEISSGDRTVLVSIDACRLADTRAGADNVGPRARPLGANETHSFSAQQAGVPCTGRIPTSATTLALNVTTTQATASSFVTFWSGGSRPQASSLNPTPGQPPTPNAVTVTLSPANTFDVYNFAGSVEIIIDVVGYYDTHNHDDRYYTKSQFPDLVEELVNEFTTPRQFRLEPTDFVIDPRSDDGLVPAVGWTRSITVSRLAGTTQSECVRAKVPLAPGMTVTGISLRYTSPATGGDVDVSLLGFESEPGPVDFGGGGINLIANQTSLGFPSTGGGVIGDLDIPLTATPDAVDGHVHQFALCTAAAGLSIFAVVITTQ